MRYSFVLAFLLTQPILAQTKIADRIRTISDGYIGKPYEPFPVGEGPKAFDGISDKPLIAEDRFSPQSFIETVLARANSKSPEDLECLIKHIRYFDGAFSERRPSRFVDRLHFMELDWKPNHERIGLINDISIKVAGPKTQHVHTTIDRGAWLRNYIDADYLRRQRLGALSAAQVEERLDHLRSLAREYKPKQVSVSYVSTALLKEPKVLEKIPDGTIFNVVRRDTTRPYEGKAVEVWTIISHQGFLLRKNGEMYLRHAAILKPRESSRVIDQKLRDYLEVMDRDRDSNGDSSVVGMNLLQPDESFTTTCGAD